MQHFPVSSSILSAGHLSGYLIKQYGFSEAACCRLLKAGINHSYLVTDGVEKYVFRVYSLNWRTKLEIEEEVRLLGLLQAARLPVSFALKDAAGHFIQTLNAPEGLRFGVLFTYAKGEKMLNMDNDVHFTIGSSMAKMHVVTHNLQLKRITYTPEVILTKPLERLKEHLPVDSDEMRFMLRAHQYLLAELQHIHQPEVRLGAVHLDIWFDNMSVDGSEITLFDFDFCGNGMLCYDIAYSILQIHSTEKDEAVCKAKVQSFLEGYESVTPISAEEKRLIPALGVSLYFFYLGVQSERYENWSNLFFNEVYIKRYIQVLVKGYFEKNGLG